MLTVDYSRIGMADRNGFKIPILCIKNSMALLGDNRAGAMII